MKTNLSAMSGDKEEEVHHSLELTQERRNSQHENNNKIKQDLYRKIIVALILIALVLFFIIDSSTNKYIINFTNVCLEWIQDNPISGFWVFAVIYLISVVLVIPGSLLTLAAGFVFANIYGLGIGVLLGTLSVFIGASLGAIIAFLIARYLLRDFVKNNLSSKYDFIEALDIAFKEKGLYIMMLLRLAPIVPFIALNYIVGVTGLKLSTYIITLLGMVPGTIMYVFIGASANSLADIMTGSGDLTTQNSTVTIVIIVIGIIFGIIAFVLTTYYCKLELNKIIETKQNLEQQQQSDETTSSTTTTISAIV